LTSHGVVFVVEVLRVVAEALQYVFAALKFQIFKPLKTGRKGRRMPSKFQPEVEKYRLIGGFKICALTCSRII
jgi:hypothetical protein